MQTSVRTLTPLGSGIAMRRNLLRFSEQFQQAGSWSKALLAVTADQVAAPDGVSAADLITPNAASTNASISQSVSGLSAGMDYVFSVWLQSTGADRSISIHVATTGGSLLGSSAITVTSSWQRFSVTANSGVNTSLRGYIGGGFTLADGETFYAWGAQFEPGTTPTSYQLTA